jgi:RNA polymerase sigma-70 factor (ECF subfamily)
MAKSKGIKDEQLVGFAKKGDTRAFGNLMLRYQNKIYRLARRMTDTDEDAEDVLQDAFIKAFRKLSTFKGRSKFSTWLYRITVNIALMKLRRRRLSTVSLSEPVETEDSTIQRDIENGSPDPLEKLLGMESAEVLDKAINGLRENYRAVFILRHVEGLSTRETADILEIDVPAVKSRLHRARTQLKVQLLGHAKNQKTKGKVV